MFFTLSKLLWIVVRPDTLLLLALVGGAVLQWTRRGLNLGRGLVTLAAVAAVFLAVVPVGRVLIGVLEDRFPPLRAGEIAHRVEGIVVLSGVVDTSVTTARGQLALNASAERLTEFAALARRFPEARLVFTGGSGDPFDQTLKEADIVASFITEFGIDPARVTFENQSRNTSENAVMAKALAGPSPDSAWVLVTSAFHMPRAVGAFRHAGWTVVPYPVDYITRGDEDLSPMFNLGGGLGSLSQAIHEWLGLFMYWVTGRSDSPFPGPSGQG